MKLLSALAAAAVALTGLTVAAPVSAQDRTVVRERTVEPAVTNSRVVVRERTTVRRSYGNRSRRVCTVRYRHGDRIRTCRTVRRYR